MSTIAFAADPAESGAASGGLIFLTVAAADRVGAELQQNFAGTFGAPQPDAAERLVDQRGAIRVTRIRLESDGWVRAGAVYQLAGDTSGKFELLIPAHEVLAIVSNEPTSTAATYVLPETREKMRTRGLSVDRAWGVEQ